MGVEVFVDGRPLSSIGYWGELEVTHQWPLGSWEMKWSMALSPFERPRELAADADVYCAVGSHRIWAGNLTEPDWATSEFVAAGAARQGETALCFDAAGLTTSAPDTAVDRAIARGAVDWTRPASISSAAYASTNETDALNYVAALLDAYAQSVQMAWYVDPWRAVRIAVPPTTPSALLMPDNGVLGVAAEAQVGTVFGRYLDSTTGLLATAAYGEGRPEQGVDWSGLGPMDVTRATDLSEGVWAPLQALTGWTNALNVQTGQLVSPGGVPIPLWAFSAGQMIRLLGVRDLRGLSASTDVVIGQSTWRPADDTLQLSPVGMVARDLRSIIATAGGVAL